MKTCIKFLSAAILLTVFSSSEGSDATKPVPVTPEVETNVGAPPFNNPIQKANCEVWIEIRYEDPSEVVNHAFTIVDAKPSKGFKSDAISHLTRFLSGEDVRDNTLLFTKVYADRAEYFFTYYDGCKGVHSIPNKSLNTDASKAGAG